MEVYPYTLIHLIVLDIQGKNHWTMNKGQRYRSLYGCTAAAALFGILYLTKYQHAPFKGIIKTKNFAFKTMPSIKASQPLLYM